MGSHVGFAARIRDLGSVSESEPLVDGRDHDGGVVTNGQLVVAGGHRAVVSGRHFDSWWNTARHADPDLLNFSTSMLINEEAGRIRTERRVTWLGSGAAHPHVRSLPLAEHTAIEIGTWPGALSRRHAVHEARARHAMSSLVTLAPTPTSVHRCS
jgi:hypothetical protein